MTQHETIEIINSIVKIDFSQMDILDQALFLTSLQKFAESMKPLVVKYSDKLPENSTFLLKL